MEELIEFLKELMKSSWSAKENVLLSNSNILFHKLPKNANFDPSSIFKPGRARQDCHDLKNQPIFVL